MKVIYLVASLFILSSIHSSTKPSYPYEWHQFAQNATTSNTLLLVAIARHETGNGSSYKYKTLNNAHGIYRYPKGYVKFDSVEESFLEAARMLEQEQRYQKAMSIPNIKSRIFAIGHIWCPADAEHWSWTVYCIYRNLEKESSWTT